MTRIELKAVDCIQGMDAMAAGSVDVVVTSPPYNLGIRYRHYNDNQKHAIYMAWAKTWLSAVERVLAPNGSFFLNLGGCPRRPLLPYQVILAAADIFRLQNTFHWIKSISIDNPALPIPPDIMSVGHFKPINSPRFVNDCHEFVFHLTKTGKVPIDRLALGVPYMDKSNVKRWSHTGGKDKRCRGNTWFIPYKTICNSAKDRPHPATFPPKLAENAIRLHGAVRPFPTMKVLDPFVGIGNTVLGAMVLGVDTVTGFDIDESYLADANHFILEKKKLLGL
jgi:site-specific DNA-methyltransferase (adenine-specific)